MTVPGTTPLSAGDELLMLRALVEGTARTTGEEFFQTLVRHLAISVGTTFAFVAEFIQRPIRVRTLAFWAKDRLGDNFEFDLTDHPCYDVYRLGFCHHPSNVRASYPRDAGLRDLGIESYLGVPLLDAIGEPLGHLAVCHTQALPAEAHRMFTFRIFAARAAAELERLRAENRLHEEERRYRDLYEEAPTAYVMLGPEGRLLEVNRRTTELLGRSSEQLRQLTFAEVCAANPQAQKRAAEVRQALAQGADLAEVEVELRHADGSPRWVRIWVKPEGEGATRRGGRSLWIDVTDRVRAENEQTRLRQQNVYLQEEIKAAHNFEDIIADSPSMRAVLDNVRRVAPTDASVLILGETGTGKELIARAVHSTSRRREGPFIKVNCAAMPTGLVESELFGHEKGAFTGALTRRLGRFELAHGGTLFLDEIGEVPLDVQSKLLRALQEHEIERVGGSGPVAVDVRILAATNRDLLGAIREKTFREDLYYRLNVFPLHLPPLRDRAGDVTLLSEFLVQKFAQRMGKRIDGLSPATMARLQAYPWPGNVRELENVLERAVILASGPLLEVDADILPLPPALPSSEKGTEPASAGSLEDVERQHILQMLRRTRGVIDGPQGAARLLELHPNTLRSRLKKMGITRADYEPS